jgi:hypothetical protein
VPPLIIDLSYNLNIIAVPLSDINIQQVVRLLKLRASEHSSHASETSASVSLTMGDGEMQAEALTLHRQVEIPLWHPDGMAGLEELREQAAHNGHGPSPRQRHRRKPDDEELPIELHPEEWLPQVLAQVARDLSQVLATLDAMRPLSRPSDPADAPSEN